MAFGSADDIFLKIAQDYVRNFEMLREREKGRTIPSATGVNVMLEIWQTKLRAEIGTFVSEWRASDKPTCARENPAALMAILEQAYENNKKLIQALQQK